MSSETRRSRRREHRQAEKFHPSSEAAKFLDEDLREDLLCHLRHLLRSVPRHSRRFPFSEDEALAIRQDEVIHLQQPKMRTHEPLLDVKRNSILYQNFMALNLFHLSSLSDPGPEKDWRN